MYMAYKVHWRLNTLEKGWLACRPRAWKNQLGTDNIEEVTCKVCVELFSKSNRRDG